MPTTLPAKPTVMPLKVRMPSADIVKRPITRPRISAGALICTSVCAIELNESSTKPATNSSAIASTMLPESAKRPSATHQTQASTIAVRVRGGSKPRPSSTMPASSAPAASAASSML